VVDLLLESWFESGSERNMRDWLTIELVLGTLLVTSFTCVGLVALWAATSPRHWFLRTVVVLAPLSPLLAVPAYEPFLIFALQVFVIVIGVQCWPSLNWRIQITEAAQPATTRLKWLQVLQFLLRMLLFVTPVVAGITLLSPLLQIPLWGPVLIFAFESAAILVCAIIWLAVLQLWRAIRRHKFAFNIVKVAPTDPDKPTAARGFQFSLQTLLLLTPLVAVVVAVGAQMWATLGRQTTESIITILLNGVTSGIAVLLATWMAVTQRKALVWPFALLCCFGIAAVAAYFDWLFPAFSRNGMWPPKAPAVPTFFGTLETHPQLAWLLVLPASALLTLLAIVFFRVGAPLAIGNRTSWRRSRILSRGALAIMFVALAAVPASFLWMLLHPLPLPQIILPNPNGFDQIVAAGNALSVSPILNTSVEPKSTAELAAEVAKYKAAYDQLHLGLSREIRVRDWPKKEDLEKSFDLSMDGIQTARSAARALMREAELADQQSRFDDAVRISFDNVRLGMTLPRDGLLVDYLVGMAIEGVGHHSFYQLIDDLDPIQCRGAIAMLQKMDADREPLDDVLYRDRIWSQHTFGWYGHLWQIFEDINPRWDTASQVQIALHRTQAISRLLILELAIRAYRSHHAAPPASLSEVAPAYIEQIPVDPFDPAGGLLRYVRNGDAYIVYSLGQDGRDNGGQSDRDENGAFKETGDLRLDVYLAPVPPTSTSATSSNAPDETSGETADDPRRDAATPDSDKLDTDM
jgi:hypothetical protein